MEYVPKKDAVKYENAPTCIVYEYPTQDGQMNMAVAEVNGRYPESGFAKNLECCEMAYVLKGSGKLVTKTKAVSLEDGSVVLIPRDEPFYWEGSLSLLISTSPSWHLEQYVTEK